MRRFFNFILAALVVATLLAGATVSAAPRQADRGAWAPGVSYAVGDTVTYNGVVYKCIQAHTSQTGWEPPNVPALWQPIGTPTPGGGATATRAPTRTNTPSGATATRTPTRTNTPSGATATRTPTRTNTPAAATSTPTRTNTPSGATATRTPTSAPVGSRVFAPYLDTGISTPDTSLGNLASHVSDVSKYFTLAFILGRDCAPYWDAVWSINSDVGDAWLTRINELRAQGGNVIISFGGAVSPYLEHVCSSASSLQAAYAAVVSKYNPWAIDLDVEDFTNVDLRNQALAGLKSQYPNLRIHYTLGVLPTGLTPSQLSVLESAKRYNLRVDLVNIMAMDYYQNVQDMGGAAIQAAQATRTQLDNLGFTYTQIGITPMIGVNDSRTEIFTLEDAQQVVNWAKSNGIALLAFWSVGRDNGGCPNGTVSPTCSGISQSLFQFSSIFRGFAP